MRHSFQDSHEAFIRDDPSLLEYMMRTPQRVVPTVSRTQASIHGPTHEGLHKPRRDEPKYESFTLPIPVQPRQGRPSNVAAIPNTGRLGSLLSEDADLTRRSIVPLKPQPESNTPMVPLLMPPQQPHPSNFAKLLDTGQFRFESLFSQDADLTRRLIVPINPSLGLHHTTPTYQAPHPFKFDAKQFASLLVDDDDDDDMTPRPMRPANLPLESIHGLPYQVQPVNLAILPETSQIVGSLLSEVVLVPPRIAISQELPQRSTDTRPRMSVASLEPSQLNQKNDEDLDDNALSLETIDYLDAVTLQPEEPWKAP